MKNSETTRNQEQILAHEPWYHGLLPREDMKVLLTQRGDFLVRFTDPKVGEPRKFVLSIFVGTTEDIRHYVLREIEGKFAVDAKWFNSIADLLNYYHRTKEPVATGCYESVLIRPIGREPWEKQHSDVTLIKKLGEGAFGEVQLGEVRIGKTTKKAAIKLAKLEALTKEQIKEIMHEARLMRRFNHPNVVTFYGVAAGQEPLMVIMELAENGALDSYLKKNIGNLAITKKHDMILQAARGLEYLHSLSVIHRDIASRNCLYGNGQVKISDFGLSREGSAYRLNPHKKVPIRWLAPEVPRTGFYTPKTDVFGYGIMCWEVYHDGTEPYPGMAVAEVLPKVQEGFRMNYRGDVPEKIVRYLTDRVCAGNEYERVTMAEVVRELPNLDGFESHPKSDHYFDVPKSPHRSLQATPPLSSKPAPVQNILPYASIPSSFIPGGTPSKEDNPKKSLSNSDEAPVQDIKRTRKPVPKSPNRSACPPSGTPKSSTSSTVNLKPVRRKPRTKTNTEPSKHHKNQMEQTAPAPMGSKQRLRGQKKN